MSLSVISNAQGAQEDIGDYVYTLAKDNTTTLHNVSYRASKGEHFLSDGEYGGKVKPEYDYLIKKTKKGTKRNWRLGFFCKSYRKFGFTINRGGKINLKLFDDSIITLVAYDVDIEVDDAGTWFSTLSYLSDANFTKITQVGVKKIRFETFPKVYDAEYSSDEIGSFLKEASKILHNKINSKTDRMTKDF